jgi:hypothetical protein
VHCWSGNQPFDLALAYRAFLFVRRAEALYLLKTVAASLATVFIKGHSVLLLLL